MPDFMQVMTKVGMKRHIQDFFLLLGLFTVLYLCIMMFIFVAPWSDPANRQMFSEILLVAYALFAMLFLLLGGLRYWIERRQRPKATPDMMSPMIEHPKGGVVMPKWEYCQLIAYGSKRDKESGEVLQDKILQVSAPGKSENLRGEDADVNKVLNQLGAEGWEGFAHSMDGLRYSVLLKRSASG
jgi:hypothetical protein